MNAILNKNSSDVKNCTIYVALFPCNECAKLIIQSGIKEVSIFLLYLQEVRVLVLYFISFYMKIDNIGNIHVG